MRRLAEGVRVGAVYWVVEVFFSILLPGISSEPHQYRPLHHGLTVLLLFPYAALGALPALVSILLPNARAKQSFGGARNERLDTAIPTGLLILVHAAYLLSAQALIAMPLGLLIAVVLILFLPLIRLTRPGAAASSLRFAGSPWVLFTVLLGCIWLSEEKLHDAGWLMQLLGMLILSAGVLLLSWIACKFSTLPDTQRFNTSFRRLQVPAAVAISLSFCLMIDQAPFVADQPTGRPKPAAGTPSVILVTLDTVRADHMSLYGYKRKTTPFLEEFSRGSTLYQNAVSSGAFTLPTHASLFTGLYPSWHGAHYSPPEFPDGRPLDPSYLTLAEILSSQGFSTAAVAANRGFLSHNFGLAQGFGFYDNRAPAQFLTASQPYFLRQGIRNLMTCFTVSANFDREALHAEEINASVFEQLEVLKSWESPFFLFINYMDAHWPYVPPAPFDTIYPGKNPGFTLHDYLNLVGDVLALERPLTEEEIRHLHSQYDGSIRYLDSQLARLFHQLKLLNLFENSLIIITSDHGEAFGDHNLMEHGVSVYQDQVHVPLIIKYPGQRLGQRVEGYVNSVDILPTVLEVVGLPPPPQVQGASLLQKESWKSRPVVSEVYPRGFLRYWNARLNRIERAIFRDGFKLIRSTAGKREIYDLDSDPHERVDLASQHPGTVASLERAMQQYFSTLREAKKDGQELDKATLDRLKALGYIR